MMNEFVWTFLKAEDTAGGLWATPESEAGSSLEIQ